MGLSFDIVDGCLCGVHGLATSVGSLSRPCTSPDNDLDLALGGGMWGDPIDLGGGVGKAPVALGGGLGGGPVGL